MCRSPSHVTITVHKIVARVQFSSIQKKGGPSKKKVIFGALPNLNLPQKKHSKKSLKRKSPTKRQLLPPKKTKEFVYESYQDFRSKVEKPLSIKADWKIDANDERVLFIKKSSNHALSNFEVNVDNNLLGFPFLFMVGFCQKPTIYINVPKEV